MNTIFQWFRSYLENGKQKVTINGFLSKEKIIKYRVPQGNVLGPILFFLYINYISNLKLDGSVVTYADDTCGHTYSSLVIHEKILN